MLEPALALLAVGQEEGAQEVFVDRLGPIAGLALLLPGLLLLGILLRRVGQYAWLGVNDRERYLGSWGPRELLELCAAGLGLVVLAQILFPTVIQEQGVRTLALSMGINLLSGAIGIGLAYQADARAGMRALGLLPGGALISGAPQPRVLGQVGFALACYLAALPAIWGLTLVWPPLASSLGIGMQRQGGLVEILALEGNALWFAILLAGLIGPFAEELVFRGFMQPVLVRRLGVPLGILGTSLLFALLHGAVVFLPLFCFSLFLGWVQLRTRCLWASWVVHGAHNSLVLALYLLPAPA